MIVKCSGVDDKDWEKTYQQGAGGIISLKSELGEPIHKLLNKGMLCWREFDDKYFSLKLGSPEAEAKIMKDKDYIIKRLNESFQKVYFGEKADGRVVDLEEMTYAEVLSRAVRLMYVVDGGDGAAGRFAPNRWIDVTYKTRVFTWMQRFERRLRNTNPSAAPVATSASILDEKPWEAVERFVNTYPEAKIILMSDQDVAFFINVCKDLRNGKPVNFVPVIDKELVFWFKKDSLWVSEQVDATIDKDPNRVCTLHGPVAVKHCMKVDEPVGEILGNIHKGYLKSVDAKPREVETFMDVKMTLDMITSQPGADWVANVLASEKVVAGKTCRPNPIPKSLIDRPGHVFKFVREQGESKGVTAVQQFNEDGKMVVELSLLTAKGGRQVQLSFVDPRPATAETPAGSEILRFVFEYKPEVTFCPLHELSEGSGFSREETILSYYKQIWLDPALHGKTCSIDDTFSSWFTVSDKDIIAFNRAILRQEDDYAGPHRKNRVSTIDFSTVVGWKPLMQALFAKDVGGDLLKLVHMSHEYKILSDSEQLNMARTASVSQVAPARSASYVSVGEDDDSMDDDLLLDEDLTMPQIVTSNGGGAIQPGQKIYTEGKVKSIEILPSGKKVTVKATVFLPSAAAGLSRRNQSTSSMTNVRSAGNLTQTRIEPWVEITSSFLIRGDFAFTDTNFDRRSEEWEMVIADDSALQTLLHQKWLSLSKSTLSVGDKLQFRVDIYEAKKAADKFSKVECLGTVMRHELNVAPDQLADSLWEDIGSVSFFSDEIISENPVTTYLKSVGYPLNETTMLESSYTLLEQPHVQQAPSDCTAYASASRDLNPIHRNNYIAEFVELPHGSPIVHGMWTCAMARGVLEDVMLPLAGPIRTFGVEFLGMVFPGETLVTQLSHVGVLSGRWIIQVDVCKSGSGEAVLKGRAEVEQPRTAYVFTGQGSAVVGMGMDRYQASPVAKNVWDTADKYFKRTYGFSILEIVQKNPKEMTIHFGGPRGKKIRENYMNMKAHDPVTGTDQQLIKEIRNNTKSFTFKSPEGLLFATQFSQPALVLVQKAAFEVLRAGGYVPEESLWAGHSLGEYAALASLSTVLSIESLVETVFLRGMVMQEAVERDATGRSNYGMVAANPYRVGQGLFTHQMLSQIVDGIEKLTDGKLIQIVNFNVRNFQYVIAGELLTLDALGQVLTSIRKALGALSTGSRDKPPDDKEVAEYIKAALIASDKRQQACKAAGKPFLLERGAATIPLTGIDVPFHSKQLLGGVGAFRRVLTPRLSLSEVQENLSSLVGRYIPNVIAEPFSLERAYVEQVLKLTESQPLVELLEKFDQTPDAKKAHILLIELLAHQFAMPVQWIDTQDVMFMAGTQRIIEMGPAPTLVNMAKQMHKTNVYKEGGNGHVEFLSVTSNEDDIFFKLPGAGPNAKEAAAELPATGAIVAAAAEAADDVPEAESAPAPAPAPAPTPAPAPAAAPAPAPTPAPAPAPPSGGGGSGVGGGPNVPPSALHALKVMIAMKLGMPMDQVQDSATIKDLSKGRSAIQNEMVGDLGAEFGSGALPEGAAEMALSAVADKALLDVYLV